MEPVQSVDDAPGHRASDAPTAPTAALTDPVRDGRSARDMAISLLVLLIPIALLFGFYRVFLNGDQPPVVDAAPVFAQARTANAFPVGEPAGLGAGWRTVSAKYQPRDGSVTLRIGYLSPDGRGVQLVQSNVPPDRLLPVELTGAGRPQGPVELAGRSWQRYTARPREQALVLLEPNRTVIVIGAAGEQELRELASALR